MRIPAERSRRERGPAGSSTRTPPRLARLPGGRTRLRPGGGPVGAFSAEPSLAPGGGDKSAPTVAHRILLCERRPNNRGKGEIGEKMLHVALWEPEIPPNTGNI